MEKESKFFGFFVLRTISETPLWSYDAQAACTYPTRHARAARSSAAHPLRTVATAVIALARLLPSYNGLLTQHIWCDSRRPSTGL
jgi:hypothetical protein